MEEKEVNVEEMNQYYRINKLENDNTTLLLRWVDILAKHVEALEEKIA